MSLLNMANVLRVKFNIQFNFILFLIWISLMEILGSWNWIGDGARFHIIQLSENHDVRMKQMCGPHCVQVNV